ncbi:hypothetical protein ELI_04035 [Erythrobacter litoralis HTCC2594]|uniref:Uncharacterized protein n=1 Tax=Erythrobacter litoralis (strain HTCC2594) TaxID=314225 RepID=Q2NBP2_ERYLH|nr:hypothetical protein ELI_04035 [Erythrobacter litoralis HTCC2594]
MSAETGCSQEQSKAWFRLPARLGQLDSWTTSLIPRFAQTTLDGSRGEVESAKVIFFDLPEQDLTSTTPKL